MPKLELLKMIRPASNTVSNSQNSTGPSFTFTGALYGSSFSIAKTKNIPSDQLILDFNYTTDSITGSFSPYVRIELNDFIIGSLTFSNSNGAKTLAFNITDSFLSEFNTSVTELKYDIFKIIVVVPSATSSSITTLTDINVSWNTSRPETYENYEAFPGNDLNIYETSNTLPETINKEPVNFPTENLLNKESNFYETSFSGVDNNAFDLVSRAIVRVTGSNNLSISGVSERPCSIEVYCTNGNLPTEENIYAWGASELISYSGYQTNDIELCFIEKTTSNSINFSAKKFGRDHKSLFSLGKFYVKGLSSGFDITNIQLLLFENNDNYMPITVFGGNTNYVNNNINIKPEGYLSSKKLMTQELRFWNCSGVGP